MVPRFTLIPQTSSPLATVTASHRASQDLPTLGEPARMCRPCEISVSTTKLGGRRGWLIRKAPSIVLSFMLSMPPICCMVGWFCSPFMLEYRRKGHCEIYK